MSKEINLQDAVDITTKDIITIAEKTLKIMKEVIETEDKFIKLLEEFISK